MKKRIGRIFIRREFLEDETIVEVFHLLRFVVLRAEAMWHKDGIEYIGTSPKFEEVPEGVMENEYKIIVFKEANGIRVEVVKM